MLNYNSAIGIRNVSVSYEKFGSRVQALRDINLNIGCGEYIYISGANGSGKSTLLKLISRQIAPDSGDIEIGGCKISKIRARELAGTIFYVQQNPLAGSVPQLTVWENMIVSDLKNANSKNRQQLYSDLLGQVSLIAHKNHLVQYLSGGQRQILTLLIAKMRSPGILLLDEPLASLDPENTKIAQGIIDDFYASGATILQVTHDEKKPVRPDSRTIVLDEGKEVNYE